MITTMQKRQDLTRMIGWLATALIPIACTLVAKFWKFNDVFMVIPLFCCILISTIGYVGKKNFWGYLIAIMIISMPFLVNPFFTHIIPLSTAHYVFYVLCIVAITIIILMKNDWHSWANNKLEQENANRINELDAKISSLKGQDGILGYKIKSIRSKINAFNDRLFQLETLLGQSKDDDFIVKLSIEGTNYENVEVQVTDPGLPIHDLINNIIREFSLPRMNEAGAPIEYCLFIEGEPGILEAKDENDHKFCLLDYDVKPGIHLLLVRKPVS